MHPLQGQDVNQQAETYSNTRVQLTPTVNIENEQKETEFSIAPSYETTIFHFNRQPEGPEDHLVYDYKTGVTSFLPQALKRDLSPEANPPILVNSIPSVEVHDTNDAHLDDTVGSVTSNSKVPDTEASANIRDSLHHYKINNDEYAVVLRSPHRNRQFSGNSVYSVTEDHIDQHSSEQTLNEESCKGNTFQRSRSHIHPVPEDDYVSRTTMHLIPQHNCLLHKIPPPPPPVNRGHWGPP